MTWRRIARRGVTALAVVGGAIAMAAEPASAQQLTLDFADSTSTTSTIIQLIAVLTVISLAPSILIMVTSFTRIVIVLSFVRSALGTQQTPPNQVLISLALFLTAFVMMPTLEASWEQGVKPLIEGRLDEFEAFEKAAAPFRDFMARHVREQDLALFVEVGKVSPEELQQAVPLRVLVPAFMISELKRAFEIGFLIFVPFLVIDMVVASVLMAMGMMMLPPTIIALPFKIIFFVLVDGWYLLTGSLLRSYGG